MAGRKHSRGISIPLESCYFSLHLALDAQIFGHPKLFCLNLVRLGVSFPLSDPTFEYQQERPRPQPRPRRRRRRHDGDITISSNTNNHRHVDDKSSTCSSEWLPRQGSYQGATPVRVRTMIRLIMHEGENRGKHTCLDTCREQTSQAQWHSDRACHAMQSLQVEEAARAVRQRQGHGL